MILLSVDRHPVIAHRGASADAPENTLAAFRLAEAQGADAFELDVHVTQDLEPVVIHDPTLQRTGGLPDRIADLPMAELRRRAPNVPMLSEILDRFSLPLLVELKTAGAQAPTARVIEAAGAQGRTVVASFRRRALEELRSGRLALGADRQEVLRQYLRAEWALPLRAPSCRCYAVPDRWKGWLEVPTARFVAMARSQDTPVHVWTVDDPDRAVTLWRRGVSGIITNRPAALLAAREAWRRAGA